MLETDQNEIGNGPKRVGTLHRGDRLNPEVAAVAREPDPKSELLRRWDRRIHWVGLCWVSASRTFFMALVIHSYLLTLSLCFGFCRLDFEKGKDGEREREREREREKEQGKAGF